jgi:FkbM family methyltransferase
MLKKFFKIHSHNRISKSLAGFGRSLNRYYENRNHRPDSNGEVTLLKKIVQFNPGIIIDGGANVGNYTNLINKYCPSSKVYCFEPVKETYNKLVSNVSGNINNIIVNKGFYKESCSKNINIFSSNEHASIYDISVITQSPISSIEVKLIKGDDFILQNNIEEVFFLKLDLEGAEYDALQGFENSLKNNIIKLIQFEYGYININTKKLLVDYYNFFQKYGYIVGKVFPKGVEFREYNYKYEDFIGPNFVAVQKDEIELIKILKEK